MKSIYLLLAASIIFISCNDAGNKRGGKLYLQSYFINGLSLNWIWLGDDGTIIYNPKFGVDPVNIKKEKKENENNIGEYEIDGIDINVTWENGKKSKLAIEKSKGDISAIDGGLVSLQEPMPDDYKLQGKYEGSMVFGNVANINTYYFKKNGKFSLNQFGAVSNEDMGATSEDDLNGSYSITGNTITLEFDNGQSRVATIGVMEMEDGQNFIIMNQRSYPQREE